MTISTSKRILADEDLCDVKEITIEDSVDIQNWSYGSQTNGAPASELFYVGVDRKYFGQQDTCEIYGTIMLYDEDDTSYELYSRDSDYPETLTPQHNLLSLEMPAECLVSNSWSHISYCLTDKSDNDRILENVLYFDKLADITQYHKLRSLRDNNVFLTYAAYPAAVVAIIEITLSKRNNDSELAPLNLSGNIITSCGNTYGHRYPGVVLLNTMTYQPIEVMYDAPIELSRDVVVVPAYSFLRIDLRLSQPQQEDIICRADFLAGSHYMCDRDIETKDFDVRFEVNCCDPDELGNETKEPFIPEKVVCLPTQICTTLDVYYVIRRESSMPMQGYFLGEVYTIMVDHDTKSELKICGSMGLSDDLSSFKLFDRNEQNPFIVSGYGNTIPTNVTKRCFSMDDHLTLGLKLRDVEGRVSIEGHFGWDFSNAKYLVRDKRICSVMRGVHSYGVLFYTIFSKALQAEVSILLKCDRYLNDSHRLGGSVVDRHSNERYLTEHERAYYQSILCRAETLDLKSGDILPLVKSMIAVPMNAFLTVSFDLYASPMSNEFSREHFTLDVSFEKGPGIQRIKGKNYSIEVALAWSDVGRIFSEERFTPELLW